MHRTSRSEVGSLWVRCGAHVCIHYFQCPVLAWANVVPVLGLFLNSVITHHTVQYVCFLK